MQREGEEWESWSVVVVQGWGDSSIDDVIRIPVVGDLSGALPANGALMDGLAHPLVPHLHCIAHKNRNQLSVVTFLQAVQPKTLQGEHLNSLLVLGHVDGRVSIVLSIREGCNGRPWFQFGPLHANPCTIPIQFSSLISCREGLGLGRSRRYPPIHNPTHRQESAKREMMKYQEPMTRWLGDRQCTP